MGERGQESVLREVVAREALAWNENFCHFGRAHTKDIQGNLRVFPKKVFLNCRVYKWVSRVRTPITANTKGANLQALQLCIRFRAFFPAVAQAERLTFFSLESF